MPGAGRLVAELYHPLADVDREVADAFEVRDELERRGDEAQVGGDRLALGQDLQAELVDLELESVDLNVLRVASFELLTRGAPTSVVIDEAIEVARRFGTEESPVFVNGVLDQIAVRLGVKEVRTDADGEVDSDG